MAAKDGVFKRVVSDGSEVEGDEANRRDGVMQNELDTEVFESGIHDSSLNVSKGSSLGVMAATVILSECVGVFMLHELQCNH